MLIGQQVPQVQPKFTPAPLPQDIKLGEDQLAVKVTAAEAGHIAMEKSPKLRLARALLTGAHGNTMSVQSGLLPQVSLTSSRTDVDVLKGGTSNTGTNGGGGGGGGGGGFSTGLSVSQLIFDFGHQLALARQAMANEKAAFHGLSRAEQDLIFATKTAFYTFTLDSALVTVQEANVKDRQAQLALAQARVDAGPGEPSDLITAKTNLSEAIQLLVQARSTALSARIALALAMGIDPRTPITGTDSVEPTMTSDFEAYYKRALDFRPDLLQSIQQLRAAGFEVQAARTNDAPVIGLTAGFSSNGKNDPTTNQTLSASLSVNWALFDGFNSRGKRISAQADLETARATLAGLQLTIGSDVATAWSVLQFAEQRLPISQSEEILATESLRIATGRYRAGIGSFLGVTDAEASLVTAQQSAASAKTAVSTAWAALRHAIGDPN